MSSKDINALVEMVSDKSEDKGLLRRLAIIDTPDI